MAWVVMLARTVWKGDLMTPGRVVEVTSEVAGRWAKNGIATLREERIPHAKVPDQAIDPVPASTPLGADFPGAVALAASGLTTREQLAGLTHVQLVELKGIGDATARRILTTLEG